jgi:hypothetical protein
VSGSIRLKRAAEGSYTYGNRFRVRPWWNEMAGGGERRREGWLLCDDADKSRDGSVKATSTHCSDLSIVRECIAGRLAS